MFCRKCGKEIPNDSKFCPKCGTQNVIEVGSKVDLEKDNAAKPVLQKAQNAPIVQQEQHTCPNCGKPISDSWVHCAYCMVPNPYNKNSKPTTVINNVVPPPQVIVKEEKVIIREEKNPKKKAAEH